MRKILIRSVVLLLAVVAVAGCQTKTAVVPQAAGPDYSRPLPPGSSALRLVTDPSRMPDLGAAYRDYDEMLLLAMDESRAWFRAPSSRQFFPFEGITHEQAEASLIAFERVVSSAASEEEFLAEFARLFDVYESVGYDGAGVVLFTGYYAPVFRASRTQSAGFSHPLYKRPADLVTAPKTGEPRGRRLPGDVIVPYSTRREIQESGMFRGNELVWLPDALSAYLIHVNGSAKLRLTDGSEMHVGYAGKTDRPYSSLGRAIVTAGLLRADEVSLNSIRELYARQPGKVEQLMLHNDNYVFFKEYDGESWPAGSLGVRVTDERSLATDKSVYPRGGLVMVDTAAVTFSGGTREFKRIMLDQDTGGAIRAPGRADIFMGIGESAEILAGGQYAEGRLYYFFLKPEHVETYLPRPPGPAVTETTSH